MAGSGTGRSKSAGIAVPATAEIIAFPGSRAGTRAPVPAPASGGDAAAASLAIVQAVGEAGRRLTALGVGSAWRTCEVLLAPAVAGSAELARIAARLAADQVQADLELLSALAAARHWHELAGRQGDYLAARAARCLHLARCCRELACGVAWPEIVAAGEAPVAAA
jgi:hypothetical protein